MDKSGNGYNYSVHFENQFPCRKLSIQVHVESGSVQNIVRALDGPDF